MRRIWSACALAGIVGLQGCYAHTAVRPQDVTEGMRVRARISAAQAERLAEPLGRESRVLVGRVTGEEGGALVLQVPAAGSVPGQRLEQRVALPSAEIVELEIRQLDRTRTAALAAAAAAAVGYVVVTRLSLEGKDGTGGIEKPGGSQVIIGVRRAF